MAKNSMWVTRGKVTPASATLMWQMIKSQHEATRMEHRKRLSRAEIENKAAVAALACYSVDQIRYVFGNTFSNLMHNMF